MKHFIGGWAAGTFVFGFYLIHRGVGNVHDFFLVAVFVGPLVGAAAWGLLGGLFEEFRNALCDMDKNRPEVHEWRNKLTMTDQEKEAMDINCRCHAPLGQDCLCIERDLKALRDLVRRLERENEELRESLYYHDDRTKCWKESAIKAEAKIEEQQNTHEQQVHSLNAQVVRVMRERNDFCDVLVQALQNAETVQECVANWSEASANAQLGRLIELLNAALRGKGK